MNHAHRIIRHLPLALILLLAAGLANASPGTEAYASGDLALAETLITAELARADDPQKRKLLGIIAMSKNDFRIAYDIFADVADALPDDADAQYWLGASAGSLAANVSLFRAAGYARKTRRAFLRAIELDPEHVAAHQGLISYYLQAPGMLGGDKDEAIALSERLSAFAPVDGKLQQAAIYDEINEPERARAVLKELAQSHPADPRALLRLGFYYQSDEDYELAYQSFAGATKAGGDGDDARNARRGALYQLGRNAVFSGVHIDAGIRALDEYAALTDLDDSLPGVDWALFRRGQLQRLAGNDAAARQSFAQAGERTDDGNLKRELKKVSAGD